MTRYIHDGTPDALGKLFRTAWIENVIRHHPDNPPQSYVTPWSKTIQWERNTATSTAQTIINLIDTSNHHTHQLHAFERGQLLTAIWNANVHNNHPNPSPHHTTPWNDLPSWRQAVNTEIFETLQRWANGRAQMNKP